MTEADFEILTAALKVFRDPCSYNDDLDTAAQSVFDLLHDRDEDPDISLCQDAVGKSGVLNELFDIYKARSGNNGSEYVTLCLTWALFRNQHNSDVLGARADFGPTIEKIITNPLISSRVKSHAMDLYDNVVNNLTVFQPHILKIVPAFVNLLARTNCEQVKGRCINSARISSYRPATREALRGTDILNILLEVIRSGKSTLAPHAACQAVANLVGHIPNHPALAASYVCVDDLLACFSRALEDQDFPEGSNTFPNDYFVCMGIGNLANSEPMTDILVSKGVMPLLQKAVLKPAKNQQLKIQAYQCLLNLSSVPEFGKKLLSCGDLIEQLRYNLAHGCSEVMKLAKDILAHANLKMDTSDEKDFIVQAADIEVEAKNNLVLCEIKVSGSNLVQLVSDLKQSSFSVIPSIESEKVLEQPAKGSLLSSIMKFRNVFRGKSVEEDSVCLPDGNISLVALEERSSSSNGVGGSLLRKRKEDEMRSDIGNLINKLGEGCLTGVKQAKAEFFSPPKRRICPSAIRKRCRFSPIPEIQSRMGQFRAAAYRASAYAGAPHVVRPRH